MKRGVILVHVLILVAMMGFMAALTLKWTLSRHMAAKRSVEENENRALLHAVQAKLFSCLSQENGWPTSACQKPATGSFSTCMGGSNDIGNKTFKYNICKHPKISPPCRILIGLCPSEDPSCTAPPC